MEAERLTYHRRGATEYNNGDKLGGREIQTDSDQQIEKGVDTDEVQEMVSRLNTEQDCNTV